LCIRRRPFWLRGVERLGYEAPKGLTAFQKQSNYRKKPDTANLETGKSSK